jgi:hypothetical protein
LAVDSTPDWVRVITLSAMVGVNEPVVTLLQLVPFWLKPEISWFPGTLVDAGVWVEMLPTFRLPVEAR